MHSPASTTHSLCIEGTAIVFKPGFSIKRKIDDSDSTRSFTITSIKFPPKAVTPMEQTGYISQNDVTKRYPEIAENLKIIGRVITTNKLDDTNTNKFKIHQTLSQYSLPRVHWFQASAME